MGRVSSFENLKSGCRPCYLKGKATHAPTPLYGTADGGLIATSTLQCSANLAPPPALGYAGNSNPPPCAPWSTSGGGTLYTLDQNGDVSAQTADTGAVYSWTGNWYDPPPSGGTVSALGLPAIDVAGVFWGFGFSGGGNPSGTRTAVRHLDLELLWCAANLCSPDQDVSFVYYQDNPHYTPVPTTTLTPAQIITVKTAAFTAFRQAFIGSGYPVQIGIMGKGTNQVQITGEPAPMGENGVSCGATSPFSTSVSLLYYLSNMEQAQYALAVQTGTPNNSLLRAIGTGIGNNAAHEVGHQLRLKGMDDSSVGTYNAGECSGAADPSIYTGVTPQGNPIKWEDQSAQSLHKIIFGW